jgi:hypothetical protein
MKRLLSPILSVGTNSSDLRARGSGVTNNGERFHVEL